MPDLLDALDRDAVLAAVVPPIYTPSSSGSLRDESLTNLRFRFGLFYPESGEVLAPTAGQPQVTPLKWVTAACVLIRRSAFEGVGGFDPVYSPAYCEDLDLSFRLRLAGWTLGRVATNPVLHRRGETTARLGADALRSLFLRNLLVFHFRFFRAGPLAWAFRGGLQARLLSPGAFVWKRARDDALAVLKAPSLPGPIVSAEQLWRLLFTTQ